MTERILYTGGTFDLFHAGHVNFLSRCKLIADIVVVSLNSDKFIRDYKGFNPFHSFEERKLHHLPSVRFVSLYYSYVTC